MCNGPDLLLPVPGWGELIAKIMPVVASAEGVPDQLCALYAALNQPLARKRQPVADTVRVQPAPYGSRLAELAQKTVDYSYSLRFANGSFAPLQDHAPNSLLITAADGEDPDVIWSTVRIAWGAGTDIFELFTVEAEPYGAGVAPPDNIGSFGRMAFHPLFDCATALGSAANLASFNVARITLTRGLVQVGMAHLRKRSVDRVYIITSELLHLWFSMCGMKLARVEEAQVAESDEAAGLRQRYPGFWQGNLGVYRLADWDLEPIELV